MVAAFEETDLPLRRPDTMLLLDLLALALALALIVEVGLMSIIGEACRTRALLCGTGRNRGEKTKFYCVQE